MFKLKSHPSPEGTLLRHLHRVGNACKKKIQFYEDNLKPKYDLIGFSNAAYIIGITHDFGKATSYFQNMLNNRAAKSIYSRHSNLSSLFTYYSTQKLLPQRNDLWGISYVVVRRHHGDLRNLLNIEADLNNFDLEILERQISDIATTKADGFSSSAELRCIYSKLLPQLNIDEFLKKDINCLIYEIRQNLKSIVKSMKFDNYFLLLSLYSALQEADKSDAANIGIPVRSKNISLDMVSNYRERSFRFQSSKMSRLRDNAYRELLSTIRTSNLQNERIFSITLPTGFGKTIAGLACAMWIRSEIEQKLGYSPRIIYSLPFLSIIDQNAEVIREILSSFGTVKVPSNIFLIHHHLADTTYKMTGQDEEQESIDLKSSIFLIEGWNSEIVITTFVQLFQSLITNKKGMLRKFNNISGSIIILDEVQAIPAKYWNVVDRVLNQLCNEFGCWVILMTATKPGILGKNKELANLESYKYYDDRINYTFRNEQSLEEIADIILSNIKSRGRVLAVLNTIGESKELYRMVKSRLEGVFGDSQIDQDGICVYNNSIQLVYLSSSVLPKTRHQRILRIKNANVKTVVVSTQVVEAGVDIDMDCVIRDFAPLDCIVQSAGRCNRNARSRVLGDVMVFTLKDGLNDRDYCTYVYDHILLSITKDITFNIGSSLAERKMLEHVGEYFQRVYDAKSQEPIADHMAKLNFDNVAEFKLIENYESIQVFMEVDVEAKQARIQIETNEDLSGRMNLIPKLKEALNNNTITVRKPKEIDVAEILPKIQGTEIRFISLDELDKWYDQETGLDLRLSVAIERRII